MMECMTRLRRWGNSLGIVIPKNKAAEYGLKPEQEVKVLITKSEGFMVKDAFGKLKQWKKPTAKIMKEIDEALDSK